MNSSVTPDSPIEPRPDSQPPRQESEIAGDERSAAEQPSGLGGRFYGFLFGMTVTSLGEVAFAVALPWLVLELSKSNLALGVLMTCFAIPRALLLLVGGVISDRLSVRNILIVANVVQMLGLATITALFGANILRLEPLYVLVFLFGAADAFVTPAANVLVTELVARDQIPRATALNQTVSQVCMVGGAAVAGVLIQYFGLNLVLIAVTLSYLAIIAALMIIPASTKSRLPPTGMRSAIAEGVQYVRRDSRLYGVFILCVCLNVAVIGVAEVGLAVLAKTQFNSPAAFGVILTSVGIGSILGVIISAKLPNGWSISTTLRWACAVLALLIAALAIDMPMWTVATDTLLVGIVSGCANVKVVTWLRMNVQTEILGRVMSLLAFASAGVNPIALTIAGFLARSHLETLMLSSATLLGMAALLFRSGGNTGLEEAGDRHDR